MRNLKTLVRPLLVVALASVNVGCNASTAAELSAGTGVRTVTPQPVRTAAPAAGLTVVMTSATLGDDCGHGITPAPGKQGSMQKPSNGLAADSVAAERRACEQTSMQLSIVAPGDIAPTELRVKRVELYDETGKRIGELTPRSPSLWSEGAYRAWEQSVSSAQTLSVTYPLTQPDWSGVKDRFNKTYTIKAIVTIGGADHALSRDVYVAGEARLPPGAVT